MSRLAHDPIYWGAGRITAIYWVGVKRRAALSCPAYCLSRAVLSRLAGFKFRNQCLEISRRINVKIIDITFETFHARTGFTQLVR